MARVEWCDCACPIALQCALDRRREACDRECIALTVVCFEKSQSLGQVIHADKWHTGIDAAHLLEFEPTRAAGVDRVLDHRHSRGDIVGELGRATEWHFCAEILSDGRDLIIVGGDDHAADGVARERRLDSVANHRLAREGFDIFSRDPFRAAARWDDGDVLRHARLPRSAWFRPRDPVAHLSSPGIAGSTTRGHNRPPSWGTGHG